MKSKTEKILTILRILAWIGLFGFAINLGAQIISFIVSFSNPAAAKDIPGVSESLWPLRQHSFQYYTYAMSVIIVISAMILYFWWLVVTLLSKLNVSRPFTFEVSARLEKMAYWLFAIWIVGVVGTAYMKWLSKTMGRPLDFMQAGNEFLFTAGIVYLISQIFKLGVEMQEENQQTI